MRILGIDPGYAILGYGIVDIVGNKFSVVDYGAITTDPSMDMPSRLVKLFDGLTELISAFKPDEANEYTPLQIKQALVGYGRADKTQVQFMVKTMLNLKEVPKPDDTADALAAAICHGHSAGRRDILKRIDILKR